MSKLRREIAGLDRASRAMRGLGVAEPNPGLRETLSRWLRRKPKAACPPDVIRKAKVMAAYVRWLGFRPVGLDAAIRKRDCDAMRRAADAVIAQGSVAQDWARKHGVA